MKQYIIIYHREDNDGVFSAAIAKYYLIYDLSIDEKQIKMCGHDYNTLNQLSESDDFLKEMDGENHDNTVILLDLSFTEKHMVELYKLLNERFIWVDHHAPIINASILHQWDKVAGLRDTHYSTIYNIFKYFYNPMGTENNILPDFLNDLQMWDSWTFPEDRKVYIYHLNLGVTDSFELNLDKIYATIEIILNNTLGKSPSHYDSYTSLYLSQLAEASVNTGKTIDRYETKKIKNLLDNYGDFSWTINGRKAVALFLQGPTNSLMFESVKHKVQNAIVFKHNADGTWSVSVYNTSEDHSFHCGNYMRKHFTKGGGHEGAAGACMSKTKFISILNSKKL